VWNLQKRKRKRKCSVKGVRDTYGSLDFQKKFEIAV
jgi:hypothetical protein